MNCVFCDIINGKIPSFTVYEDDVVKVFLDIHPDSNGHLLVIPKEHTLDLNTIDDRVLLHIMHVARNMRVLLQDKLGADGVTLIQNNGLIQDVKHFHLHLKPYYKIKQEMEDPARIYDILMGKAR